MSEAGWRRIEEVFHRAVEIPHEARASYLDEACNGDETLRREVESLLAHDRENGSTFAGSGGAEAPQVIAHYRISGELGRGGMGTVYRATDTKLGREVAIKILPANFARDPDRLARFTREARVLASLNHPNIAAVYGVEDRAIVMELVEGADLKGPLPLDTALKYLRQIAEGLDAAHQKGIAHRDLKPANVKVTPQGVVKMLDFGLAKATRPAVSALGSAASAPAPSATAAGLILGTPAYMSPEQACGADVDKRADIWAFGVIVCEVLTGRKLFGGQAASDVLAAVLKAEPDLTGVPAPVRRLVSACLEKDPSRRLRDIGDWERLLETAPQPARAPVPSWIPWSAAACLALAAALAFWGPWRAAERPEPPFRQLDIDVGDVFNTPAISPDALTVAFVQNDQLAVRRLDQAKSVVLGGTQGAWSPFFSPDSRWIAFFSRGKLRKISVDGDSLQTICDASNGRGGAWVEGGFIVFAPNANSSLWRVPAVGGQPQPLTTLANGSTMVGSHRWVSPLPAGRGFLYTTFKRTGLPSSIRAMSLNGAEGKTVVEEGADAHYVNGRLFYYRLGAIYAQPFDLDRLEITGPPVPIATGVAYNSITGPAFAVAADGTLVYRRGPSGINRNIAWLDAKGQFEILTETPGGYIEPRLSPDGKQLAFALDEEGKRSVWTLDVERKVMRQVARGASDQDSPIWTPDGRRLLFRSGQTLAWTQSDGSSPVETIQTDDLGYAPEDFSPDGRWLLFSRPAASGFGLWRAKMQIAGEKLSLAEPRAMIEQNFEAGARISPDGKWVAYQNLEAQRRDSFVIPFSPEGPAGSRKLLWAETRIYPVWSRRKNEIYFRDYGGHFYVASWSAAGGEFTVKPGLLWTDQTVAGMQSIPMYDVAPEGNRLIVMLQVPEPAPDRHLHILLNINQELARRAAKASGTK